MTARKNILLKVTGSIAAFKAAALASKLTQAGYVVRTILSSGASEFIGAPTFEGLTGEPVFQSTFSPGSAMAHIDLAKWAELTLVYPASANTLTKLAGGRADDLLGSLFLAHGWKTPYWIAPAMNPTMFAHPAITEAVAKLRGWGAMVLEADAGRMACGDVGYGRLIEPEAMVVMIDAHFSETVVRKKVLVTGGGTSESVDPVRVLTNTSTGETGVRIANALAARGNLVTLLLSENSPFRDEVLPSVLTKTYRTFHDLDSAIRAELANPAYESVVHAAAVSDYRIDRIEDESGEALAVTKKIGSAAGLVLRLKPNPKILAQIRKYAKNPELRVISFKLATSEQGETTDLSGYDSDLIVYNRVADIERGSDRHAGEIFTRRNDAFVSLASFATKSEMLTKLMPQISAGHSL